MQIIATAKGSFGCPIYLMIGIRSGRPWSTVQRLSAQDEDAILMVFSGSYMTIWRGFASWEFCDGSIFGSFFVVSKYSRKYL